MSVKNAVLAMVGCELGGVAGSIAKSLDDKKVNFGEGIDIAKEIGELAFGVIRNRDEVVDAFVDGLNDQESAELKAGFSEGFEAEAPELEADIEAYFSGAVDVATGVSKIIAAARD